LRAMIFAVGGQARPCRRLGMQSHDWFLPEPEPPSAHDQAKGIPWQRQDRFASGGWGGSQEFALHCSSLRFRNRVSKELDCAGVVRFAENCAVPPQAKATCGVPSPARRSA
jgi:hypothetical protein